MSWSNAKAFCERQGGHLATIVSEAEQHFLESYLDEAENGPYWIGLTNGDEMVLQWVTNEPVKYQNWMGANPDYEGPNSGVRMASGYYEQGDGWIMDRGTWDDAPETWDRNVGFVCEWEGVFEGTELVLSADNSEETEQAETDNDSPLDDNAVADKESEQADAEQKADVPEDAKVFRDHAYKAYFEKMSWNEAKERCEKAGGHLATITSPDEQGLIAKLVKDSGEFWIGLRRVDDETFAWVTGEEVSYTNWGDGEPNNYWLEEFPGENSVAMRPDWNDYHENNLEHISGYICEWE